VTATSFGSTAGHWRTDDLLGDDAESRWYIGHGTHRMAIAASVRKYRKAWIASAWGMDDEGDPMRVLVFQRAADSKHEAKALADAALRADGVRL
jgi:hypothetical protein